MTTHTAQEEPLMNRQQAAAYAAPCYVAEATLAAPHWGVLAHGQPFSITLSSNVGLE